MDIFVAACVNQQWSKLCQCKVSFDLSDSSGESVLALVPWVVQQQIETILLVIVTTKEPR